MSRWLIVLPFANDWKYEFAQNQRASGLEVGSGSESRQQAEVQAELEHITEAIRQGILTPTTRTMLEDAERRVSSLAQGIAEVRRRPAPIVSAASSIERYVTDLRSTLATNPDKARRLLARGVRQIVLRRDGPRLWADLEGDLAGVLDIDDSTIAPHWFGNHGAGRGI